MSLKRIETAAYARYPAACLALGQTLEALDDLMTWTGVLEARVSAAIPFVRLALCWHAADFWREESGEGGLDAFVFAIQEELYEPSSMHRREVTQASIALEASRRGALRGRWAQAMLRMTRSTAVALLDGKSPRPRGSPYGYLFPLEWSFSHFVTTSLWVFETNRLVDWIAEAVGERVLYEGDSLEDHSTTHEVRAGT
ncbi:MAG: hypothetical protein JKY65_20855 [Planctomycetes bacterium]|nr:hypothetical protein [Planctomycetota bacterium]